MQRGRRGPQTGGPTDARGRWTEIALLYLVISVLLLAAGPGKFAADAWLQRKLAA
ncbi:hypothetical protein ACN469_29175 [Corallococcus terminator]